MSLRMFTLPCITLKSAQTGKHITEFFLHFYALVVAGFLLAAALKSYGLSSWYHSYTYACESKILKSLSKSFIEYIKFLLY